MGRRLGAKCSQRNVCMTPKAGWALWTDSLRLDVFRQEALVANPAVCKRCYLVPGDLPQDNPFGGLKGQPKVKANCHA